MRSVRTARPPSRPAIAAATGCGQPTGTDAAATADPARPQSGRRPTGAATAPPAHLGAAAHLDQQFSDAAIAEYLVEDVRAVPPTPGVDAVAVQREAVAARERRRIRDAPARRRLGFGLRHRAGDPRVGV